MSACRDEGPPEAQRNRALLINGAPVELAASALTVLVANGFVTTAQAKAADEYARLRGINFGIARPDVAYDLVEPRSSRLRSEARLATLRGFFEAMVSRVTWDQKLVIDRLVVTDALPGWFVRIRTRRPLRPSDVAERAALLDGLAALARR